jgi:hypothetical protein
MKIMKHVGDVVGSSTREELFIEGNEDEDEYPCERRRAYKKVYCQSYRHWQVALQAIENTQGATEEVGLFLWVEATGHKTLWVITLNMSNSIMPH